jgi:hypothetical protein
MDQNGILSIVAIAVSISGTILAVFNHRRVRSHCCGKDIVASIDVESTTPPNDDLKIKIPKRPKDEIAGLEIQNLPPSPEAPRLNRITYDA